jgi:hypothetical protein
MSKEQWFKILKGAAIAFLAAGMTSLLEYGTNADFGPYTGPAQAVIAILLNAVKVLVKL